MKQMERVNPLITMKMYTWRFIHDPQINYYEEIFLQAEASELLESLEEICTVMSLVDSNHHNSVSHVTKE